MRPRRSRRRHQPALMFMPLVDVIFNVLAVILMSGPQFNLRATQLPGLRAQEGSSAPASAAAPRRITLKRDGTIQWQGQTVSLADALRHVRDQTSEKDTVQLVIETADGQGPVAQFLQLQADCGNQSLWGRFRVIHRSADPVASVNTGTTSGQRQANHDVGTSE